jgi:AcrR family transcriptional regulator
MTSATIRIARAASPLNQKLSARYGDIVPDERRARMMRATMALVARTDVPNVTMDRIAEEAGVSRITLYREFGNRAALFEAVIAYRLMLFDWRYFEKNPLPATLPMLLEDYFVATTRISKRNPVTRRWVRGGLSFLRQGSMIHRVAVGTWRPIIAHYGLGERLPDSGREVGLWINVLQYAFARLSVEAGHEEDELRRQIRLFVAPAFNPSPTPNEQGPRSPILRR